MFDWHAFYEAAEKLDLKQSGLESIWTEAERRRQFEEEITRLYHALIAYNQNINLTRITVPQDFLFRHILDSLTILPWLPVGASVIDVGSGAGFPAIPLLLARPDLSLTAVESVGKKCGFIVQVRDELGLGGRLTVLNERSETLGRDSKYRIRFDVATARAVAALPILLELCIPLIKPEGSFLAIKGANFQVELDRSTHALSELRATLHETREFVLPEYPATTVLCFRKTGPTPVCYPRLPGIPAKKPL